MDIYAVREAIASSVHGLAVQGGSMKVTATAFTPDQLTTPHFFVAEYDIDYDKTMRGLVEVMFTCRLLLTPTDEASSQKIVDSMFSPTGTTSLKATMEAERDYVNGGFGGLVADFTVTRMQGNRLYDFSGVQYVGGEIIVRVIG